MLTRRDTTQAERRQAKYYQIGDVIQPERNYVNGVLVQGKMYRIVEQDVKRNRLTVELFETGVRTTFNPSRAAKLSVYQPVQAELSAGDWVACHSQRRGAGPRERLAIRGTGRHTNFRDAG